MKNIAWVAGLGALIIVAIVAVNKSGLLNADFLSQENRRELQALSPAGQYFGAMCLQEGYSEWMLKDTLRQHGRDQAVLGMIETLKFSNPNARACAAWCLGKIGDPKAIAPLEAASKDSVDFVKTHATEALEQIRGRMKPSSEKATSR